MTPEDFVVKEETGLKFSDSGKYRIYEMEKRSWNTTDAVSSIAAASGVDPSEIRHAGMKDRHALTTQHLSVPAPLRLTSSQGGIRLRELGFSDDYVSSRTLLGNRFSVILRDLSFAELESIRQGVPLIGDSGFSNFYDDQRFGSYTTGQGFFARRLLMGHLKGALRIHLTAVFPDEPAAERSRKEQIGQVWGKWQAVKDLCVDPGDAAIADALSQGGRRNDLLFAVNLIPRAKMSLYLSAYQSHLWNLCLERLLAPRFAGACAYRVPGKVSEYVLFRGLSRSLRDELAGMSIPTIARKILPCDPGIRETIEGVLEDEGIRMPAFGLRGVRGAYFSSFERKAVVVPSGLRLTSARPDDKYPGKSAVGLQFGLPSGSYATMLIKTLNPGG